MNKLCSGIAFACALVATTHVRAAENYLDLSSPDFKDGGALAQKYGGNNPQNPNCTG